MRRSERQHLKENALAVAVSNIWMKIQNSRRILATILIVGFSAAIVSGGYLWWSGQAGAQAGALLSEALELADAPVVPPPASSDATTDSPDSTEGLTSDEDPDPPFSQPVGSYPSLEEKMSAALPKLLETADTYPENPAGITARYRAAAALAELGRHQEAADHYQQVIDLDAIGIYGRMAILGLAATQISQGEHGEAIALLEESSTGSSQTDLPLDGVLMELARAYRLAGRVGDARATYQRVMDEFPTSLYFNNAERELQMLNVEG